MSDAWMFPNIPGMGASPWFSTGTSGLSNAQSSYAANQNYLAQQQAAMAAAQMPQSQLYGGGSFGAQPAYYAALGAAYGRGTGGFGGAAMGSVFDQGTTPYNDYGGGANPGGFSPSPNYPGAITSSNWMDAYRAGNAAALSAQAPYNNYGGEGTMGSFSPSPNYPGSFTSVYTPTPAPTPAPQPSFNDRWGNTPWAAGGGYSVPDMISLGYTQSPGAMFNSRFSASPGGGESPNWSAFGMFGQQPDLSALYRGLGIGQPAAAAPNFAQQFGAAPAYDPNSFANRFAAGGYFNPGTPSQYYTGDQYGGGDYGLSGMLPPGFATPFSANNPGGALPFQGFRMDQQ